MILTISALKKIIPYYNKSITCSFEVITFTEMGSSEREKEVMEFFSFKSVLQYLKKRIYISEITVN